MPTLRNTVHRKRYRVSAPRALFGPRAAGRAFIIGYGSTRSTLPARILSGLSAIHSGRSETGAVQPTLPKFDQRARLHSEAAGAGRDLRVEETPRHVHPARAIRQWLPNARLIVSVRNGRDIATSLAGRYGSFRTVFERWILGVRASIKVVETYGARVFRLADLIENSERAFWHVCSRLDVGCGERLLRYADEKVQWGPPGEGAEHTRLPNQLVQSPIRDSCGRWRTDLTPLQIARIEPPESLRLEEAFGYHDHSAGEAPTSALAQGA